LIDYGYELSVWEISHRWFEENPNTADNDPSLKVQDLMRGICYSILNSQLEVCRDNGAVLMSQQHLPKYKKEMDYDRWVKESKQITKDFDVLRDALYACYKFRIYDREILDRTIFLNRQRLESYCIEAGLDFPVFWFPEESLREFEKADAKRPPGALKSSWAFPTPKWMLLSEVAERTFQEFWSTYDEGDGRTAPGSKEIYAWISKIYPGRVTRDDARVIQRALRSEKAKRN